MQLDAKRILIYGVTGSGKTTFAAKLSARIGIPWHSVDDLTWDPGWTEVAADEQSRRVGTICDGDAWILDTAYAKWINIPLERAELIVGLDYSRALTFGRLLKRSVARAIDKRPICNGNTESFRLMFSRDSILLWHFKSFSRKRTRMRSWATQTNGPKVILFSSPRAAERWLASLAP